MNNLSLISSSLVFYFAENLLIKDLANYIRDSEEFVTFLIQAVVMSLEMCQ